MRAAGLSARSAAGIPGQPEPVPICSTLLSAGLHTRAPVGCVPVGSGSLGQSVCNMRAWGNSVQVLLQPISCGILVSYFYICRHDDRLTYV